MAERRGFQTAVWGPPAWMFLHTLTFAYPEEPDEKTKRTFMKFFGSLCAILPCKYCRASYSKYCKTTGPLGLTDANFASRKTLTRWLYNIHDAVNQRIGKTDRPSFSQVKAMYEQFVASPHVDNEKQHGCVNGQKRLRSVIRVVPRECKLSGKTLKIYRACKQRYVL